MSELEEVFARDGFVVLERALSPEQIETLRSAALRLAAKHGTEDELRVFRTDDRDAGRDDVFFASARGIQAFLEAEAAEGMAGGPTAPERRLNKIGHALHDLDPDFRAFAGAAFVRDAFRIGGLSSARLVQSMLIFKPPGIGGEVRWHQDASYLRTAPQRVVGIWIALENADRSNGCLWMSRGAHRGPLRERYAVDWKTRTAELQTLDHTPWPTEGVPLEVPAGTAVIFHDHMPHRSDANRGQRSRLALTFHGHASEAEWLPDNWLQREDLPPFAIRSEASS